MLNFGFGPLEFLIAVLLVAQAGGHFLGAIKLTGLVVFHQASRSAGSCTPIGCLCGIASSNVAGGGTHQSIDFICSTHNDDGSRSSLVVSFNGISRSIS